MLVLVNHACNHLIIKPGKEVLEICEECEAEAAVAPEPMEPFLSLENINGMKND